MAKANWLTISPMSGTGNAIIRNIGSEHTGRLDRTTTVTGKAVGVASEKTYSVVQHAKSEFVAVNDASYQVAATGGTVTVSGTSNSPLLTVTVDGGGTVGTLTVKDATVTNGQAIAGDPGAAEQYSWKVQIQVAENPTASQRSLTVKVQGSSSSIVDTIEVVQAASLFTYEYVPSASVPTIAASGGNSVVSAQLKTYRNGSLISTQTVTPTLTGSATGFSISGATVTAANRGTTVGEARSITVTCNYVTSETGETLSETVTVTQAANNRVVVYGKPTITSFEVADIPASGGSVSSGDVEYSQSRHYYYDSGVTEELSSLTTGGQVTFGDPVTAKSLGTTLKDRTIIGQLTCQVSMNGQTSVEGDASVYQQENTFISWEIPYLFGGSLPPSGVTEIILERVVWNWTSGHYDIMTGQDFEFFNISTYIESDLIDDDYSGSYGNNGEIEFTDVGVVPNETLSRRSGKLYLHITADDTSIFDHTEEFNVYQNAGTQTYSGITVNLSYPQASAAGGTVNPTLTYSQTWGWNGSTTGGGTITSGAQVSYSGTNINSSTGAATIASKGTTVSGVTTATTATVTVSMNGKTAKKSVPVQQAANVATYGDVTITDVGSLEDIPASGATVDSTFISSTPQASQTVSFTSGATRAGSVSFSYNSVVVSSRGTSITNRTRRGDMRFTATGEGGKFDTGYIDIYQEGNYVTSINVTAGTFSYSDISAGATSASPTVANASVRYIFSSGHTSTTAPSSAFGSLSRSISYSKSSTDSWITGIDNSSGVLTVQSRGTVVGEARTSSFITRTEIVTWTPTPYADSEGVKSDSVNSTATLTQEANVRTDEGIEYGSWQVSVVADRYTTFTSPCPASGGTCTITASASRTRVQNYSYTSGSTSTETLSNESGTPTLSISGTGASLSGTTVTWASRGTTTGEVRQATVTATIDSESATEVVYQQANSYEDEYNNPVINRPNASHNFGSEGGTWDSGVSVSQTGTRTYTSGATSTISGSASFTLITNANWLTTSGGSITASENTSSTERDSGVTIRALGSGSKTAFSVISITQDAGAYLNVSPASLSFTATGGTESITIDTNESWTIS